MGGGALTWPITFEPVCVVSCLIQRTWLNNAWPEILPGKLRVLLQSAGDQGSGVLPLSRGRIFTFYLLSSLVPVAGSLKSCLSTPQPKKVLWPCFDKILLFISGWSDTMYPRLASDLQQSSCLSAGIAGLCQQAWVSGFCFNWKIKWAFSLKFSRWGCYSFVSF